MRSPLPAVLTRVLRGFAGTLWAAVTGAVGAVAATLLELLRILREALVIPGQVWLAIAELAGAAVLAVWRAIVRVALAAYGRARAALHWAQDHVRPAYGVIAVCVVAAAALVASQFMEYRGVSVGVPAYSEVRAIAPAPEVGRERTGAAHGWAPIPLAVAALLVTMVAVRGRWRVARLLLPIGLAVVAISLAVDAPKGLDAAGASVAYEGADAVLLEGFWAQLLAGAVLACCGPLLAAHLRPASERAPAGEGRRRGRIGSRHVANGSMRAQGTST